MSKKYEPRHASFKMAISGVHFYNKVKAYHRNRNFNAQLHVKYLGIWTTLISRVVVM